MKTEITSTIALFVLLFAAFIPSSLATSCSCYQTDAGISYSNAVYFDFRHLAVPSTVPEASSTFGSFGSVQPGYLTSEAFTNYWSLQAWTAGTVAQRDPANAIIASNPDSITGAVSMLVLRNTQFPEFNSGTEMAYKTDTHGKFTYGSFRYRGRITGAAGACAGFFTYFNDTQETDIEVLTRDPTNFVHYTNQPGWLNGAEVVDATTDFDMHTIGVTKRDPGHQFWRKQCGTGWDAWKTWRMDWKQGITSFYINGIKALDKTVNVPSVPLEFIINLWSNGDPSWSGTMAAGTTAATDIEWIEFFYEPTTASDCCLVDGTTDDVLNGYAI